MDRRAFNQKILTGVTSFALLDTLFSSQAFSRAIQPLTDHWAIKLNEYCADLRKDHITVLEWQSHIEQLFEKIELSELLNFIEFDRLIKGLQYPDLGVTTRPVTFPKLSGLPPRTAFVKKIFGMKKDRAIIPHGHSNMSSAHLVLKGDMHVRHYDKVRKEDNTLIIKPTIDTLISPGDNSSISDEKDNVHWFVAQTESAFTFDVIMLDLQGAQYDIHNLDMYEQEKLSDGSLQVPILDVQTALKKYGKESHH